MADIAGDRNGFPAGVCQRQCRLAYNGLVSFHVRTGDAEDRFEGNGATVEVQADLGDGNDVLVWGATSGQARQGRSPETAFAKSSGSGAWASISSKPTRAACSR